MTYTAPFIRTEVSESVSGYGDYMSYSGHSYDVCEYRDIVAEVTYRVVGKDDEGADIEAPLFHLSVINDGVRSTEVFHSTVSLARRIDEILASE
jgi:hypothetical protein